MIHMYAINATGATLPYFGFQLSTVKGRGSSSAQAGTFTSVPSGMGLTSIGLRSILGHRRPLNGTTTFGVTVDSVNNGIMYLQNSPKSTQQA